MPSTVNPNVARLSAASASDLPRDNPLPGMNSNMPPKTIAASVRSATVMSSHKPAPTADDAAPISGISGR